MNYLLAITGSIASYKSIDVARLLVKNGHHVKVILTQGALEFIRPETFRYLGIDATYLPTDDFNPKLLNQKETVLHIELTKWADKIIIAPASANTIARLSLGLNNDLLGSLFLANKDRPVLIFPAMNTQMWENSRTQEHIKRLSELKNIGIINPISGLLACGDVGQGKFPEVSAVVDLIETYNPTRNSHKHIIITAGATVAPIDPVRFVTNPSIGKMGIAVASHFLAAGYKVTLLAGHQCESSVKNLLGHPHFKMIEAPTTELMKQAALKHFKEADLYISTGAIADIEFDVAETKLKKETMGDHIKFHQASDILKEILGLKKANQKVVSFAAETETTQDVFQEKMKRKPVDLMIGNKVSNGLIGQSKVEGFQNTHGSYFFITKDTINGPVDLSKSDLAEKLVQWFEGKTSW